ncbi:MAG: hypothetical protein HY015_10175 [Bacteroidetes bacterium]|nr:hypothetical protein [Bacteroidota bacterium]MBI3483317.1 hypothetical protein [Bacteroidota bacterium]
MKPLFVVLYFLIQGEIPFKNSDEFLVKIDIKFKQKPSRVDQNTFSPDGERLDRRIGEAVAFLVVNISQVKILDDELKIQVVDSKGKNLFKKKTTPVPEINFEMGFVDDLKKGVTSNEITVYFLSSEKKELRKIVCAVLPDGTFEVNGKWHGKF